MDDRRRVALLTTLAKDQAVAADSPSPFYAALIARMLEDVRVGGPTWTLLEPYATKPPSEWYCFRALSGVHYEVLAGERPELARHWPSVGGDGDAEAAWPHVRDAFTDRDPAIVADLRHPLQTNETSRCGALIGGFLAVARATGLPLRVLELGSSGGLNLHFDRYRYEADGAAFGPAGQRGALRRLLGGRDARPRRAARGAQPARLRPRPDRPHHRPRSAHARVVPVAGRAHPLRQPARRPRHRPRVPRRARSGERRHVDRAPARRAGGGRRDRRLPLGLLALPARRRSRTGSGPRSRRPASAPPPTPRSPG